MGSPELESQDFSPIARPSRDAVSRVPLYFVDGNFGTATAFGVARITFGAFKFDPVEGSQNPMLDPVVTIAVSEEALLEFAREVISRAETVHRKTDD